MTNIKDAIRWLCKMHTMDCVTCVIIRINTNTANIMSCKLVQSEWLRAECFFFAQRPHLKRLIVSRWTVDLIIWERNCDLLVLGQFPVYLLVAAMRATLNSVCIVLGLGGRGSWWHGAVPRTLCAISVTTLRHFKHHVTYTPANMSFCKQNISQFKLAYALPYAVTLVTSRVFLLTRLLLMQAKSFF